MGYPTKLLASDERLLHDLHPHWKVLILPIATMVLILAVGSFSAAAIPAGSYQAPGRVAVLVLALVLLVFRCGVPFLRWTTTHFVMTDRRVLVRTGVLGRTGRDVPLSRINDITFHHTLMERVLGCGTLVVESAGERGQVTLSSVPGVERLQRELYELVERTDARLRTVMGEASDPGQE